MNPRVGIAFPVPPRFRQSERVDMQTFKVYGTDVESSRKLIIDSLADTGITELELTYIGQDSQGHVIWGVEE